MFYLYKLNDIGNLYQSIQLPFTLGDPGPGNGARVSDGKIYVQFNEKNFEMSIHDLALQGKHNTCNSMAAAIVGKVSDIRSEYIRECLSDLRGLSIGSNVSLPFMGSNSLTIRKLPTLILFGMHLNR